MTTDAPSKPLSAREAVGCLGFALGLLCVIIGCLLLTTAPGAVHRWRHRDGFRPTGVEVSKSNRSVAVRVASTGEQIYVKTSVFEVPLAEGPRMVLYNPDAFVRGFGIIWLDNRVVNGLDTDFQREAAFFTSGVIAFFTAGYWLITFEKAPGKGRSTLTRHRRRARTGTS
jgi:hypothetical protein